MNNYVLTAEISVPGINVALVDLDTNFVVPRTAVFTEVNTHDTAENLIKGWSEAIELCAEQNNFPVYKIALAMTGPCDYEKGLALMKNQNKFEALYQLNIKELLAAQLGISPKNILMKNNTACLLQGEVFSGCAQVGFTNVLGFSLNMGFGTARYFEGESRDMQLWNLPFKEGIAENYLGIGWITNRYEEFTGFKVSTIKELVALTKQDDGIGQLVFNEYAENYVKFLLQLIKDYQPQLIVMGGIKEAWGFIITHVKDRLSEKNIKIPVRLAALGPDATLIGAAHLWD
ncbi:MAG: ROK family protein [Sphingobacteriaceae bacterium]|nr:ROK family protein [Sphingobacteriaceae bacterium]